MAAAMSGVRPSSPPGCFATRLAWAVAAYTNISSSEAVRVLATFQKKRKEHKKKKKSRAHLLH